LLFLRGLPADEQRLNDIWKDASVTPCVLWPGDDALSVEELKLKIGSESELLLIVPDGTFSSARRMIKKYPPNCLKVALSSQSVLEGKRNSFLYPVRKYGGSEADTGRVSTLEAVAAFMREMGEHPIVSDALISNMKIQMDRALKQKSKAMVYGTILS